MNKLKMKIIDWEPQSLSLIVKFTSDVNSFEVDDARPLAFQPLTMFPGVTDIDEVLKRIAVSGIGICENEAIRENALKNASKLENFANLKDQTFEYDVSYLVNMHKTNQQNTQILDQPVVEPEDIYVC
jgi:hypothetical protein